MLGQAQLLSLEMLALRTRLTLVLPVFLFPQQGVHKLILREFLNPRHWRPPEDRKFPFSFDHISALCDAAERCANNFPSLNILSLPLPAVFLVRCRALRTLLTYLSICMVLSSLLTRPSLYPFRCFMEEASVLRLRAPIKIFGDLHGQFGDLMRLFEEYGTPSTAGDIT